MQNKGLILRILFFLVLLVPAVARTQDSESRLTLPAESPTPQLKKPWSVDFLMELRSRQDLRQRPQNSDDQSVHEISLGGRYEFDTEVATELELTFEKIGNESQVFPKTAFIQWRPWRQYLDFKLGQQFLPVGLINPRDNWFSSNPPFYQKLLTEGKAVDLGFATQVHPFAKDWLYFEGSVFSGRMVREEDQRNEAPESAPRIFSLKSDSDYHQAFLSYLEHDLAFYDPVKAWGAGFELQSKSWRSVKASLLTEYWQFQQIQRLGPDERTEALVLFGQLKWWRLTGGYRWSESLSRIANSEGSTALPIETSRLAFLDVQLAPVLSLRAERVVETQSQVLRDEWVARALLSWSNELMH